MVNITWRRTIIGGNNSVNPTYVWRKVFDALNRIAAYKNVTWIQSSGGAQLTIACVNYNIGKNVLMWTNGKTIYVPRNVNWGNWLDGMVGAMAHELGHAYGSGGHNTQDAGLMRAGLYDPAQNFTPGDFRSWYTQLPGRPGAPAPWSEPNRWRGTAAVRSNVYAGPPRELIGAAFGHPSIWQRFKHMFETHVDAPIEE
jgi:hypothetical protein